MSTETMAIISDEGFEKKYIDESEIKLATFEDLEDCSWNKGDMGLSCACEGLSDNGEQLYTAYDFEGAKTWEEISDITTDWYAVKYWDGNNWKTEVFEYYTTEEMPIDRDYEAEGSPLYEYCYTITRVNGDQEKATQSNMSGHLSPYYFVSENGGE